MKDVQDIVNYARKENFKVRIAMWKCYAVTFLCNNTFAGKCSIMYKIGGYVKLVGPSRIGHASSFCTYIYYNVMLPVLSMDQLVIYNILYMHI